MTRPLLLASGSQIRADLLRRAGVDVTAIPARIDELEIRRALQAEHASPRDIADALAESKAARIAQKNPAGLVLGCDQILEFDGAILTKPTSPQAAADQVSILRGQTHRLLSAVVLYDAGQPVWRHIGVASLTMHPVSDTYRDAYVARNWPSLSDSVGGYKLEVEGVRLFSAIEGDYFTILGLPLLPLLTYLSQRGFIDA